MFMRSQPPCCRNRERKCARKVNENILTYAGIIYFRQLILAFGIP
jgi:hypothetical protein